MGRRMRESVSAALWAAFGALGLSKSRWLGLPHMRRRVVKAVLWVGIGLLLIVFFGVWKTSALASVRRMSARFFQVAFLVMRYHASNAALASG